MMKVRLERRTKYRKKNDLNRYGNKYCSQVSLPSRFCTPGITLSNRGHRSRFGGGGYNVPHRTYLYSHCTVPIHVE